MTKYNVMYEAGESRYENGRGIDYMLVWAPGADGEEVELYAEEENPTWNAEQEWFENDCFTYESLKAEIIQQAKQNGVNPDVLLFYHDHAAEGDVICY